VASDALRYPARHADVLVIADRAAAHAATDAIRAARGRRRHQYARGKGTVSPVEAALAGFGGILAGADGQLGLGRAGQAGHASGI
jgi:hypothetical protein